MSSSPAAPEAPRCVENRCDRAAAPGDQRCALHASRLGRLAATGRMRVVDVPEPPPPPPVRSSRAVETGDALTRKAAGFGAIGTLLAVGGFLVMRTLGSRAGPAIALPMTAAGAVLGVIGLRAGLLALARDGKLRGDADTLGSLVLAGVPLLFALGMAVVALYGF